MHDYFEILGVPRDARASEIRRACRRRLSPAHPDIRDDESAALMVSVPGGRDVDAADVRDAAIDFANMAQIVDRMRAAFFAKRGL